MREYHGFKQNGNWYKGNIHSHTTVSDGMLTPEQSAKLYKDNGYQFMCFSEHDIFTDFREQFNTENFIILPAVESSVICIGQRERERDIRFITCMGFWGRLRCRKPLRPGCSLICSIYRP